jgi:hypothetical protein
MCFFLNTKFRSVQARFVYSHSHLRKLAVTWSVCKNGCFSLMFYVRTTYRCSSQIGPISVSPFYEYQILEIYILHTLLLIYSSENFWTSIHLTRVFCSLSDLFINVSTFFDNITPSFGARGATELQTGSSRDRFPMVSEFFIDTILPVVLWPWGRLSL